jgi:hypothetical protein
MKASVKEGVNKCGLIGVAIAFLFAAVPISLQMASADSGRQDCLITGQCRIEDCGLKVPVRQDDSFSKRVMSARKQLAGNL